ncbi:hypothetical protein SAY86_001119 [Trapa natans]|uniref:Uncharacterized protein n=1 Tax=Trapa natans TaxID=22666 RepID=A0AAN7MG18_TRANT|nr:hypothetical protein SAY86_001119 [Trapa natans]
MQYRHFFLKKPCCTRNEEEKIFHLSSSQSNPASESEDGYLPMECSCNSIQRLKKDKTWDGKGCPVYAILIPSSKEKTHFHVDLIKTLSIQKEAAPIQDQKLITSTLFHPCENLQITRF